MKRIELLPLSTTVIEILESVKPEPEVIAACAHLKDLGYRLALDDFTGRRAARLRGAHRSGRHHQG